ncbi:MAG TPA: urease accessory protein UreD, partial [Candidatus Paceibacterota bacterium]|nr:urease accessory protein UreD [Candidatus Paceibacterota bacterium]
MPLTHPETMPVRRGNAQLTVASVAGQSAVTSAFASNPLKLLTPRSRGQSVWACTSSFGGGFVAGDETHLDLELGKDARCFLGTQASTKVYRNPRHRACGHVTEAVLTENSLLVFAPDPVQPFAGSSYRQRQTFHLGAGAGLALVDWFTSGRAACGERWAFDQFQSRNDVFLSGERIFMDSIRLDSAADSLASP